MKKARAMNTEERLDYLEGRLAALEEETEDDIAQFGGLVAALQITWILLIGLLPEERRLEMKECLKLAATSEETDFALEQLVQIGFTAPDPSLMRKIKNNTVDYLLAMSRGINKLL